MAKEKSVGKKMKKGGKSLKLVGSKVMGVSDMKKGGKK